MLTRLEKQNHGMGTEFIDRARDSALALACSLIQMDMSLAAIADD